MKSLLPVLAVALAGCGGNVAPPEGTYTMCREVAGYSGETIELKDGQFRYWFYSDAGPSHQSKGRYSLSGNTLTFDDSQIGSRTIAVVNGIPVQWRADGLDLWKKDGSIHPYAVLIRVEGVSGDLSRKERPSLESLKTSTLKDREEQEYQDRYNDQPAEARVLLRARSLREDPHMAAYRKEITRARGQLDPKLVAQLIALTGHGSAASIQAGFILNDLFTASQLVKDPPPFLDHPPSRKKALEALIDGLSSAPDRSALEETIVLFLRVTEIRKIDLPIEATGHRIKMEALPHGVVLDCQGTAGDDIYWLKSMSKIIPACQKWMREQLGN